MAVSFGVDWNATNTASSTVPMINGMATATNQIAIYQITSGSDASADNAAKYQLQRSTARQTQSASITPQSTDQNITQAAVSTWDTTWNINPSLAGTPGILQWAQHQRATVIWVAYDYSKMLRTQAGTTKGIALLSLVVSSAFNGVWSVQYDE